MDKILETNSLDLDTAKIYMEDPHPTGVIFPYRLEQDQEDGRRQGAKRKSTKNKGIKTPVHKSANEKYNKRNMPKSIKKIVKKQLRNQNICTNCKEKVYLHLIACSLAKSTWKRYDSANKLWEKCKAELKIENNRFSKNEKIAFLCWCTENTTLKSQTISMYISAISKIHNLTNKDMALKNLLKGCKNTENKTQKPKRKFKSLDFSQLQSLKKKIFYSTQTKTNKKTIWAACVLAFWGCFRLGEILAKKRGSFDRYSDLLWKDVNIRAGRVEITLKSSKTSTSKPVDVILAKIPEKGICPFRAMKSLKHGHRKKGLYEKGLPVFRLEGGEILTKAKFLNEIGAKRLGISGKSFRSGIPTLLAHLPHPPKVSLIKSAGRWKSAAYQTYIGGRGERAGLANFENVASMLLNQFFYRAREEAS